MFTAISSAFTVIPVPCPTFRPTVPEVPPPVKPSPAVTPSMSPVEADNTPAVAVIPVPAIADAKSAMLSFFELLSPASIIAILSFATSTAAAVSSLRSSASETVPLVPPPLKPSPAATLSISPAEVVLVIVNVPAESS